MSAIRLVVVAAATRRYRTRCSRCSPCSISFLLLDADVQGLLSNSRSSSSLVHPPERTRFPFNLRFSSVSCFSLYAFLIDSGIGFCSLCFTPHPACRYLQTRLLVHWIKGLKTVPNKELRTPAESRSSKRESHRQVKGQDLDPQKAWGENRDELTSGRKRLAWEKMDTNALSS